jgi:hypothetical protein
MLAGVDEHLVMAPSEGRAQGGRLDQLRPCPDHAHEAHEVLLEAKR